MLYALLTIDRIFKAVHYLWRKTKRMKLPYRYALMLLIFFTSGIGFGQDSPVYFNEIQFDSPMEKVAFRSLNSKQNFDLFSLIIANGSLLNDAQIEKSLA